MFLISIFYAIFITCWKKSIINFGLSFGNSLARAYPIHQKVESDVWKQTVIFRFGQKNSSNDNHSKLISQSEHL